MAYPEITFKKKRKFYYDSKFSQRMLQSLSIHFVSKLIPTVDNLPDNFPKLSRVLLMNS